MFGTLFIKECRQTARSLMYWLVLAIMGVFFFTQMGDIEITGKPQKGLDNYGIKYSRDETVIMEGTLGLLAEEYYRGSYTTYPIGFYKSVKLNEKETRQMGEILEETTGITDTGLIEEKMNEHYNTGVMVMTGIKIEPRSGLTFERFQELMKEADDLLSGGSNYNEAHQKTNSVVPKTYEDALEDYETLVNKDRLTGGYARLFCDYMGIILGLIPAFLAVTRGLRDKRAMMQELIASRRGSSAAIVVSRYLAMVVMLVIPVLVLSCLPLAECLKYAQGAGISVDYTAFVTYTFGWLLPTIMAAASIGMVLTELTDTALGALVQVIIWFISIFTSMASIRGGLYGWSFIPRHNTSGNYEAFREGFSQLAANRILYAALALILVGVTILIYSQKRKGRLNIHGKIFRNRERKSKA